MDFSVHDLVWIGHQVQGGNKDVAAQEEEYFVTSSVYRPNWHDVLFMASMLYWQMFEDANTDHFMAHVFSTLPVELAIEASACEVSDS